MPRFVMSRPLSAQHPITEFYREEFLKHHRCLQQHRPYYSETAITDVEVALARIMGQLEQLCTKDDADKVVSSLLKKFDVVTGLSTWSGSEAFELTLTLPQRRLDLLAIVRAAIQACEPRDLVAQALRSSPYAAGDRVWLVAAGKAADGMAAAAAAALGNRLRGGVVVGVSPAGGPGPTRLERLTGGHPVPNAGSEVAGRRALAMAAAARPDERVLVLLSGGASALLAAPAAGLTLADKQRATTVLLNEGAEIHRLNAVRKHLSAIKGGQLAVATVAPSLTLMISDVVGDDPSVVASGPTVADPSTFRDAVDALDHLGGRAAYPAAVVAHLERGVAGESPETPKPGDPRLARAGALVVGGRRQAMEGAAATARRLGYHAVVLDQPVVGEARQAAVVQLGHMAEAAAVADRRRPVCVISSGETTVRVTGLGRGGRNQEFALAAATMREILETSAPGRWTMLASVGTDGVDGPTDAAGAMVDSTTVERARRAGLAPPFEFLLLLQNNDAYAFFAPLGDLIKTGPTGTNVGDLQVFLSV